jgi:hypothetical protein
MFWNALPAVLAFPPVAKPRARQAAKMAQAMARGTSLAMTNARMSRSCSTARFAAKSRFGSANAIISREDGNREGRI